MTNDIKHSPHLTQDEIELLVKAGVDTTDERFSAPTFREGIIQARNTMNVPEEFQASLFAWLFSDNFQASPSQREDLMYELINHCFYRVQSLKEEGYKTNPDSLIDDLAEIV